MLASVAAGYEAEVRRYLVGRLASERTSGPAEGYAATLDTNRLLNWWLFEGKRYQGLTRPLAREWETANRQARRLLASHNPHWRLLQSPEGEVDWLATALRCATAGQPEYVCRTSQLGLSLDEAGAVAGWRNWVAQRWIEHTNVLGVPQGVSPHLPWVCTDEESADPRQLKRWALTARRSRWPLLRNIVAESLRVLFEPQIVNQLPLPSDPATLFELVCLVRILRALVPEPRAIRWLDLEATQNVIQVPGVSCHFQRHIPRDEMLATAEFDSGLREAMTRHGVRAPARMDGLFVFDRPRNGFGGILLEAKSGLQDASTTIFQLKCYRSAIRSWLPGPIIVWGVVEGDVGVGWNDQLSPMGEGAGDLWIFSPPDALERTTRRLLTAA